MWEESGILKILCQHSGVAPLWFEPSKYVESVSNGYQTGPLGLYHKHLCSFSQNLKSFSPSFSSPSFALPFSLILLYPSPLLPCQLTVLWVSVAFFFSFTSGTQQLSC